MRRFFSICVVVTFMAIIMVLDLSPAFASSMGGPLPNSGKGAPSSAGTGGQSGQTGQTQISITVLPITGKVIKQSQGIDMTCYDGMLEGGWTTTCTPKGV